MLVTHDLVGGSFCADDGSADPYSMLQAFLTRARGRGLRLHTGHPVADLVRAGDRVTGVRTSKGEWSAPIVVDCAGPYADQIGRMAGVSIPSKPYRRQVMVTEPLPSLPEVFALIVDLDTGFYVHRQGLAAVLMGGTDKDIKPGLDTEVDWSAFEAVFRAAPSGCPRSRRRASCAPTRACATSPPTTTASSGPRRRRPGSTWPAASPGTASCMRRPSAS